MSEMVPKAVREGFRQSLWSKADEMDWGRRSALERASMYGNWARDKEIGGVLSHYMDPRKVRVYIKDTLMKPYQRTRLKDDFAEVLVGLQIDPASAEVAEAFSQPHGRRLVDGRVICWGSSRDWKSVVFSVFERSFGHSTASAYAAVFVDVGPALDDQSLYLAEEAGRRLGIAVVRRIERTTLAHVVARRANG